MTVSISGCAAIAIGVVCMGLTFVFPVIPALMSVREWRVILIWSGGGLALAAGSFSAFRVLHTRGWGAHVLYEGIKYGVIGGGAGALMGGCLITFMLFFGRPGYVRDTERFQAKMAETADIAAIRAWAEAYEPPEEAEETLSGIAVVVPQSDLPGCIGELKPRQVRYSSERRTVNLIYGGGFGHWGLVVAPEGTEPRGDYVLPLENGAWVWHEIQ